MEGMRPADSAREAANKETPGSARSVRASCYKAAGRASAFGPPANPQFRVTLENADAPASIAICVTMMAREGEGMADIVRGIVESG